MIFSGETHHQWITRMREWHLTFAYFPTQMDTGEYVWWEYYSARLHPNCRGGYFWQKHLPGCEPSDMLRPPPPGPFNNSTGTK